MPKGHEDLPAANFRYTLLLNLKTQDFRTVPELLETCLGPNTPVLFFRR